MPAFALSDLANEYKTKFDSLRISADHAEDVKRISDPIAASKQRYDEVSRATGVPWFVVGIIHSLEAGTGPKRFQKHLHNGDPLSDRTVQVPAGRPRLGSPPFDWEESAIDALEGEGLHRVKSWTVERIAFEFEKYNGMGYRRADIDIPSPYLWSYSQHYSQGKFKADGVFSATLVSKQAGAMVLLKDLVARQGVVIGGTAPPPPVQGGQPGAPHPYPGHVVFLDDPDMVSVRLVQSQLNAAGIGEEDRNGLRRPLDVDGEFGPLTEAAVRTFQSRSVETDDTPLAVDGEVGPRTWAVLFGGAAAVIPGPLAATGLIEKLIQIAEGELAKNVRENPLGSNRGPEVDQYIRSAGLNPASGAFAWCVCFVHFCYMKAAAAVGQPNPFPKTAGVHNAWQLTGRLGLKRIRSDEARADKSLVRPGQVFFLDHGGGLGHVGIIVGIEGESLITIEGNTNVAGGREGIGVFKRKRPIRTISLGFGQYVN